MCHFQYHVLCRRPDFTFVIQYIECETDESAFVLWPNLIQLDSISHAIILHQYNFEILHAEFVNTVGRYLGCDRNPIGLTNLDLEEKSINVLVWKRYSLLFEPPNYVEILIYSFLNGNWR